MREWQNLAGPQPLQYINKALFAGYVVSIATAH